MAIVSKILMLITKRYPRLVPLIAQTSLNIVRYTVIMISMIGLSIGHRSIDRLSTYSRNEK